MVSIMCLTNESKEKAEDNRHWVTEGLITKEFLNGKLVKETKLYINGNKEYEKWFRDGELHREGAPAKTVWYPNGNKSYEWWYKDGKLSREGGSAVIWWYSDGTKWYEQWFRDGKLPREGEPAETRWYSN